MINQKSLNYLWPLLDHFIFANSIYILLFLTISKISISGNMIRCKNENIFVRGTDISSLSRHKKQSPFHIPPQVFFGASLSILMIFLISA